MNATLQKTWRYSRDYGVHFSVRAINPSQGVVIFNYLFGAIYVYIPNRLFSFMCVNNS